MSMGLNEEGGPLQRVPINGSIGKGLRRGGTNFLTSYKSRPARETISEVLLCSEHAALI